MIAIFWSCSDRKSSNSIRIAKRLKFIVGFKFSYVSAIFYYYYFIILEGVCNRFAGWILIAISTSGKIYPDQDSSSCWIVNILISAFLFARIELTLIVCSLGWAWIIGNRVWFYSYFLLKRGVYFFRKRSYIFKYKWICIP